MVSLALVQHTGSGVWDLVALPSLKCLCHSDRKTCEAMADDLGLPAPVIDAEKFYNHHSRTKALERAMAVTTYNRPRPFSWSFSKLKNYETCPKRHYHVDVVRDVREPESEELKFGNELHDALAKRLGPNKIPLPAGFAKYEVNAAKVDFPPGYPVGNAKLLVEQKLAITKDYAPCDWKSNEAWYRGIADVLKVAKAMAEASPGLMDRKAGHEADYIERTIKKVMALPEVQKIRAELEQTQKTKGEYPTLEM